MFVLQNTPQEPLTLPGLQITPFQFKADLTKFDLTLIVTERGKKMLATLEYKRGMFEPETIKRMLDHYVTMLAAIVADPDQKISDLQMISEDELRRIEEWSVASI